MKYVHPPSRKEWRKTETSVFLAPPIRPPLLSPPSLIPTSAPPSPHQYYHLLADAHPEEWAAATSYVASLGLENPDKVVARAFAWSKPGRAYWREAKQEAVPDLDEMRAVVSYLTKELSLSEAEVVEVLDDFPQMLGCEVEGRLAKNVAELETKWKLSRALVTKAVKRKPEIMGYNIDCLGDCVGDCQRCWARF